MDHDKGQLAAAPERRFIWILLRSGLLAVQSVGGKMTQR